MEAAAGGHPAVGPECPEEREAGPGTVDHADRDGVVEGDDGVVVEGKEDAVEGDDLGPVGRLGGGGFVVHGEGLGLLGLLVGCQGALSALGVHWGIGT